MKVFGARGPLRPVNDYYAFILHRALAEQLTIAYLPDLHSIKVRCVPRVTLKLDGN